MKVNGYEGFEDKKPDIDFYEDAHSISSNCQERYKCHHCDKSYKNLRSLNQHFREVQVCRVCKMSSPSIEAFTSHILEDHTIGALCGFCMISFRSRARLVEHVRTHTQLALKKPEIKSVRKPTSELIC
jgi:hypothetical protein